MTENIYDSLEIKATYYPEVAYDQLTVFPTWISSAQPVPQFLMHKLNMRVPLCTQVRDVLKLFTEQF